MAEIILESRMTQNAADAVDDAVMDLLGVNRTDVVCLDIPDRLGTVSAGRLATESRLHHGAVRKFASSFASRDHRRSINYSLCSPSARPTAPWQRARQITLAHSRLRGRSGNIAQFDSPIRWSQACRRNLPSMKPR
jgi:hypothetical protein